MEPNRPYLSWGLLVLRGVVAILFGAFALSHPLAALAALVIVFGIWAFVDGMSAFALFFTGWRAWPLLLIGALGVAVAIVTLLRPGITAVGLYAAVAAWAIVRGALEIAIAVALRRRLEGEVWMILAGLSSMIFGVLLIALPAAGVLALAWLLGVYAIVFGIFTIALGVRLHGLSRPVAPPFGPLRPV